MLFFPSIAKEGIFNLSSSQKDSLIILPHLDSAKNSRQVFINGIDINPSDIVILSTNHFNVSPKNIIYSNSSWVLEDISLNQNQNNQIQDDGGFDDLLKTDHGIRNVIVDLASKFKQATYHNYLVKSGATEEELKDLQDNIKRYCEKKDCLIVGSVDFSHYNPNSLSQIHDRYSIGALESFDENKIKNSETDSPEVLEIVSNLAKEFGQNNFEVFENSNTGEQSGNFDTETTSWVIGRYSDKVLDKQNSTELMFAGDIMMDRLVDARYKNNFKSLFSEFKDRVFAGVDASIANFEGPLNDGPVKEDVSVDNLLFNFPLSSLEGLKYINLSGFTLANNHTLNDGTKGLSRTRTLLDENNFFEFGSPKGVDQYSVKELSTNPKVSLIGINVLEGVDQTKLVDLIRDQKSKGNFVVIYPHWGAEYQLSHGASQQKLAYEMIDAGADMIVGSHPHVVQDSEIYKGKAIFYSLGNFVFDQLFSKETQQGLILAVNITESRQKIVLVPVESKNLKPQLATGSVRLEILRRVMPKDFLNQLESGIIELNR